MRCGPAACSSSATDRLPAIADAGQHTRLYDACLEICGLAGRQINFWIVSSAPKLPLHACRSTFRLQAGVMPARSRRCKSTMSRYRPSRASLAWPAAQCAQEVHSPLPLARRFSGSASATRRSCTRSSGLSRSVPAGSQKRCVWLSWRASARYEHVLNRMAASHLAYTACLAAAREAAGGMRRPPM